MSVSQLSFSRNISWLAKETDWWILLNKSGDEIPHILKVWALEKEGPAPRCPDQAVTRKSCTLNLVEFSEVVFFFFSSLFFIINALNSVIFVNVSKCLILKSTNSRSKLVYKTKRPSLLGSLWFGLYSKIQSIEKCPAFLELCSQQRNAQCEENIYLCDVVSEIPAHSWELTLCLGPAMCPGVFLAQDSSSCRMEP